MEKQSSNNSSKESSVEKQLEKVEPETEVEETPVEQQQTGSEETTGNTEVPTETHPVREATPDIIRKSPVKEVKEIAIENIEDQTPKKNMISSEATEQEQAKMRIAEKRREMKEKKEKEAELERQKQVCTRIFYFYLKKRREPRYLKNKVRIHRKFEHDTDTVRERA